MGNVGGEKGEGLSLKGIQDSESQTTIIHHIIPGQGEAGLWRGRGVSETRRGVTLVLLATLRLRCRWPMLDLDIDIPPFPRV